MCVCVCRSYIYILSWTCFRRPVIISSQTGRLLQVASYSKLALNKSMLVNILFCFNKCIIIIACLFICIMHTLGQAFTIVYMFLLSGSQCEHLVCQEMTEIVSQIGNFITTENLLTCIKHKKYTRSEGECMEDSKRNLLLHFSCHCVA